MGGGGVQTVGCVRPLAPAQGCRRVTWQKCERMVFLVLQVCDGSEWFGVREEVVSIRIFYVSVHRL